MAKKTPRVHETFHLANEESFKDYHDNLNGQLYDISASRSGESYTVLFYTQQTHNEMKELLQDQYQFQTNKNNCVIDTNFILCDKKSFLTCLTTKSCSFRELVTDCGGFLFFETFQQNSHNMFLSQNKKPQR